MKTRILMYWEMYVRQNVKFFLNFFSCHQYTVQFLCQCWFINRSSRSQMFYKIDVLENIAKFTKKHHWRSFFFYKIAVFLFAVYKFFKKETLARLLSYEFCEIFKKTFLIEHRSFYIKIIFDFKAH